MSATKKLLDAYKNTHVRLNGRGISDVIIMDNTKDFKNVMTGTSSKKLEDVLRPRKRFIVLYMPADKWDKLFTIRGYYFWHDKKNDILFMCTAGLQKSKDGTYRWEQRVKACISKEDGIVNVRGFQSYLADSFDIFDIAGQTVLDVNNPSGMLISRKSYSVGSKNAAFEFGGGKYNIIWGKENRMFFYFDTFIKMCRAIESFIARDKQPDMTITFNKVRCFNNPNSNAFLTCEDTDIPLPKTAKRKMNSYVKYWAEGIWMGGEDALYFSNRELRFSIIQNVDGTAVYREYEVMLDFMPKKEDLKFRFIEIKRVYLCDNESTTRGRVRDEMCETVIWCDDMKGTVIEHTDFLIRAFLEMMDKEMKKEEFTEARYNVIYAYRRKFGVDPRFAPYISAYIGQNRVAEAVHSALTKEEAKLSMYESIEVDGEALPIMVYGGIDPSAKTLNGMLKMPKGMFEHLENKDCLYYTANVKNMFAINNEIYEYFMNMNKEDVKTFVDNVCVRPLYCTNATFSDFYLILPILFEVKGVKNWNKYVDFFWDLPLEDRIIYKEYVRALEQLQGDEIIENCKWNVKGEELRRAFEELEVYIAIEESRINTDNEDIIQRFKKQSSEWEKYLYENGEYKIVCPKDPKDLVIEGSRLSHCLKEFITIVGCGNTTILFIRRVSEPEKPYFTLEIRDGRIRQCHGFANSNVESDSDLEKFLKEFCKEKDVIFALGCSRLGI